MVAEKDVLDVVKMEDKKKARADLATLLLNKGSQEYLWFFVCQNRNLFSPSTACLMMSCSLEVRLNNLKISWSSCS